MSYKARLKSDLDRFVDDNIIARDQADKMLASIPDSRPMLSVANILIILAALLFAAALFSFIAANWDDIPRLVRISLVLLLTWGGYLGSAYFLTRGQKAFGEGLALLGIASFVAGISLVGQMYHLTGDERTAVLLCFAASFLAALFLKVSVAGVSMAVATAVYLTLALSDGQNSDNLHFLWIVPVLLLLSMGLALWVRSKISAHVTALVSVFFALSLPFHFDEVLLMWAIAAIGVAKFISSYLLGKTIERLTDMRDASLFYTSGMALAALLVLQIAEYDDNLEMIIVTGLIIVGFVIAIIFFAGGRMALRWLAYAGFGFELIYLYVQTVGSILGTAGFFLVLSLCVLLIAIAVIRFERRFNRVLKETGKANA